MNAKRIMVEGIPMGIEWMSGLFEFPVQELEYKIAGERHLKLYIFNSGSVVPNRPAILFFHGGSFAKTGGSISQFQHHAKYFANQGFVTMCVDCRNGSEPEFSPKQAISDARDAFAWVLTHATDLGICATRIVMCGASSGGYTVLCSVMIEEYHGESSPLLPSALVIFNAGVDGVEITNRLFPHLNDQALATLSPLHHVKTELPPMMWFVGTSDAIYDDNKRFCELCKDTGTVCEFVEYDGMDHGFFNYGRHENVPYIDSLHRMKNFLMRELTLLHE